VAKAKVQLQEEVSPNLIPMIDIMFLLLLFFMLGADMGQRELEEVRLPWANAIKEDAGKVGEKSDRFTVNIYHLYEKEVECSAFKDGKVCRDDKHWRIAIKGVDYTDTNKLVSQLKLEAEASSTDPTQPVDPTKGRLSERPVMVRADETAPYGQVQKVINACAKAGIYKIEVGAARPPDNKSTDTKAAK
jgi:biopolymer transport protein ExbD